jgi:hypothetical protein
MTSDRHPEPDLLAFLRDDLPPAEAEAVRRRLAADAALGDHALREELGRLEALFRACRGTFDPVASDPAAAAREAERVAAVVRSRAHAEERRAARDRRVPSRGRAVWVRVLAASVFVHAVLVAALALTARDQPVSESGTGMLHASLPRTGEDIERELAPEIAWPNSGGGSVLPDPMFPETEEASAGDLGSSPAPRGDGLPELRSRLREHPPSVALDMLVRTDDALKRRRLDRLALDADGTLIRVKLGLKEIASRQRDDGSFEAAGGRTEVGETALAMLPFLGDGRASSRRDVRDPEAVANGLGWLRRTLFAPPPAGEAGGVRLRDGSVSITGSVPVTDLGIALTALAEDFMLSFGRLSPTDAARRVSEMETLSRRIAQQQGTDGGFVGSSEDVAAAVWPVWGLYAAARTGTVATPQGTVERFRRWYDERPRTPEGIPLRADGTPDAVLAAMGLLFGRGLEGAAGERESGRAAGVRATWVVAAGLPERDANLFAVAAGSGLLLHDPASFRAWNHETADAIAARLDARGVVRQGDPVGDTALVLLALQAAYRTY